MQNIYEVTSLNKRKSFFVVMFFVLFTFTAVYFIGKALAVYYGYNLGGFGFIGFSLIISGLISFLSYLYSDRIVLGISGAKPANRKEFFDYYTVTENLAIGSGLPKPKLYVISDSAPNAFATGRNPKNSVVCATTGILKKLDRTELEGVIAHELSHIKNYDMLLMSLVSVMVGTIALLGDWFFRIRLFGFGGSDSDREENGKSSLFLILGILFAILSPIVAQLIQLAISRRREFLADAGSAMITKQPGGLISALKKIANDQEMLEAANKATAHLYIVNPFKNIKKNNVSMFANLFNTHPPVEERIKALEKMI